jgi:hypothetical protein
LSFLDRGNIGNAKIEGLAEDLKLTGAEYNWCLTGKFDCILSTHVDQWLTFVTY